MLNKMSIMAEISFSAKDVRDDLDWSFSKVLSAVKAAVPEEGNFHWKLKRKGRMAILTIYQNKEATSEDASWQAYKVERTLRGLRRYNLLK